MIFDTFEKKKCREFPRINFMSKSEWNRLGKRPASALNCYGVEVMGVYYRDEILYIQKYFVGTSNNRRAYRCPPKATHSPKTMSICTFSRY